MTDENTKYLFVWVVFFSYATCMALLFQNLIVPNLFSDGGSKLLPNDAIYFDSVAWALAENIRENGWGVWRLFVANGATGNAGILAALYAVFGHDVSVIVPVNAAMHALSGTMIFIIANTLASNKTIGLYAGLLSGTFFITFPSALSWYGQVHKDSYAILGTLLILFIWVKLIKQPLSYKQWPLCLAGTGVAILLIGIVRPYGLTLLLAVSSGALLIVIISFATRYRAAVAFKQSMFASTVLIVVWTGVNLASTNATKVEQKLEPSAYELTDTVTSRQWQWETSDWLPFKIEKYIAGAASTRFSIIKHDHQSGAGSTMDEDIVPKNTIEVIKHLPRAMQVAVFAPFPSMWLESNSIIKLLSTGEMLVYYLCIFGCIFLIKYNRKPEVLMTVYFAVAFLTILGFTMANLGTLYRVRYAYFFILLMLGILGWVTFLVKKGVLDKVSNAVTSKVSEGSSLIQNKTESGIYKGRRHVLTSAISVMTLTFIGFIGFFYRDILMAQVFGLSADLDGFFVAISIPMTVVTILCIPLGAAFTPVFFEAVRVKSKVDVQNTIATVSAGTLITLLALCILIYILLPEFLPHLLSNESTALYRGQIETYITLSLSILFFSGSVVLGNAVLNALGKATMTATIQIVVPITAILTVLLYGEQFGVRAVIWGMVLGQVLNLIILETFMRREGYSLRPDFSAWSHFPSKEIKKQYLPLVASAFFVSVSLLVSTLLAMSLPSGAVSAFTLGNKVIILITGILGAAISAVLLPYFSMLITQNYRLKAKHELSKMLLLLTSLSIPFSAIIYALSDQLITMIFLDITQEEVAKIASVMRYAILQVPFFACNILLLKFVTATGEVLKVLFTAVIGLILNVGISLSLIEKMGVEGIVIGASASVIISTIILVMILTAKQYIKPLNVVVLLLNWMLFMTLLINISVGSHAGAIAVVIAYALLILANYLFQKNIINPKKRQVDDDNFIRP